MRLFPEPTASLPLEDVYTDLDLPAGNDGKPYTLINAVATLDGRGALGGKSTPIGSDADHRLMRNIRTNVDAVLVGAGTLRSEDLTLGVDAHLSQLRQEKDLGAQPLSIILTRSGSVPMDRKIFREAADNVVLAVVGGEAARGDLAGLRGSVRAVLDNRCVEGSGGLLETLVREFGISRLLVEGGPSVNRSFFEAGLVDELFLTLAPKIVGGDAVSLIEGTPIAPGKATPEMVSVHLADSELFLRYALRPPSRTTLALRR